VFGDIGNNMNDEIKVILAAGLIPTDSIVRKITGTYKYKISRQIKIYPDNNGKPEVIDAKDGSAFLISCENVRSDISCVSGTSELVWLTTEEDLHSWLAERIDRD